MPSLSDDLLLLLDNLIYLKEIDNDQSVKRVLGIAENQIANGKNPGTGGLEIEDWKKIINAFNAPENSHLKNYVVQNYVPNDNGMRAAAFVDNADAPTDVNIVFRGTGSPYEWHDNGEGGYLTETVQQRKAAEYINSLPKEWGNDLTVTGHSKGGNKAQFVTIVTDRISRCVSFDGQGFSPEFFEKYAKEIAERKDFITSISAKSDYVNVLMIPIAGTRLYIDVEGESFIANHFPHIMLDENGKLLPMGEESDFSKFINDYSMYILMNVTVDSINEILKDL
mgnify:CR=1 FL=1